MTKKIMMALICGALLTGLTGCTKSTIVDPESNNTPGAGEVVGDIEIDWQQVADDSDSFFNDKSEYPYGKKMSFFLNEDKKEIALTWVVEDDIPEDEALVYASDLACEFNDIVAVQDSSIALSSEYSLGGLYDEYALIVGVLPEGTENDPSKWFVNVELAAGENNADAEVLESEAAAQKAEEEADASSEAAEETEATEPVVGPGAAN